MAKRQRVNNNPRWPSVAAATSLPNVSGSPTQSSYLEVGDTCFVTGDGALYVCTLATLGAATWTTPGGTTEDVIFEWNGVDTSQFTQSGDANWTVSVDSSGPNGVPRLVFTTTTNSGDKHRFFAITDLVGALPQQYTMFLWLGPYSGNGVATQRVQIGGCPIFVDSTRYLVVGPQGDNIGGNNSQNLEAGQANGGGPSYGSIANNCLPYGGRPKGLFKFQSNVQTTEFSGGVDVYGAKARLQNDFGVSVAGGSVGFRIAHFGTGMAVGDSGYIYGLKIVRGLV